MRGAQLARIPEAVAQDQAAFGVGVDHFDRLPFSARQNVTGLDGAAAWHVLGRGHHAHDPDGRLQQCNRAHRAGHGGAPRHVVLHALHAVGRLDRNPARVERDALADEPEHRRGGRSGRIVPKDDDARRLAAAAGHSEQQAQSKLADFRFVEDLDAHAGLARNRRGAPGKFARRQRVARFVGELAREVAAVAQDPSAVDCDGDSVVRRALDDESPGRNRGRRLTGLVDARIEFRQRQPFRRGLGERCRIAHASHEHRHALDPLLPCRQASGGCHLPQLLRAAGLPGAAADEHDPPRPPAPIGDPGGEQLIRFGLKFLRTERAADLSTGRLVDSGHCRRHVAFEPGDDHEIRADARHRVGGERDGGGDLSCGHPSIIPERRLPASGGDATICRSQLPEVL